MSDSFTIDGHRFDSQQQVEYYNTGRTGSHIMTIGKLSDPDALLTKSCGFVTSHEICEDEIKKDDKYWQDIKYQISSDQSVPSGSGCFCSNIYNPLNVITIHAIWWKRNTTWSTTSL